MPAGLHSQLWDGRDERGALVPSGTYLLKIDTGEWSEQQKVMLVR
jgi:flagellar hook assembly protein FlgD